MNKPAPKLSTDAISYALLRLSKVALVDESEGGYLTLTLKLLKFDKANPPPHDTT